ncbi:MAG: BamA/TamA family outer membrane protein, partial [Bacteroidota bacterium]
QREIFGLGTFQLATVDVDPETPPYDSTVSVVVRVREAPLRVLRAFLGYYTEGGLTVRTEATHRNAFGGARQATATIEARTGILDQSGVVDGLYDRRASISLRQPYVFYRALSYTLTPSVRQRNDEIERSDAAGLTNTLLFTRAPLQTAALNASIQTRRVDAFGSGASGFLDLASVVEEGEPLAVTIGTVGSDVTLGFVDDPFQPRSGLLLRPSVRASISPLSDFRFARGGLTATGFVPLGERTGLTLRASGGAFSTRGETTLDDDVTYLLLRDQYFYGGGATDVRGWAVTLLGPKVINFRQREIDLEGGGTRLDTTVTGYAGLGGRAKLAGSLQLNLPFVLGEQWGSSVFVDAGQVWA